MNNEFDLNSRHYYIFTVKIVVYKTEYLDSFITIIALRIMLNEQECKLYKECTHCVGDRCSEDQRDFGGHE